MKKKEKTMDKVWNTITSSVKLIDIDQAVDWVGKCTNILFFIYATGIISPFISYFIVDSMEFKHSEKFVQDVFMCSGYISSFLCMVLFVFLLIKISYLNRDIDNLYKELGLNRKDWIGPNNEDKDTVEYTNKTALKE